MFHVVVKNEWRGTLAPAVHERHRTAGPDRDVDDTSATATADADARWRPPRCELMNIPAPGGLVRSHTSAAIGQDL